MNLYTDRVTSDASHVSQHAAQLHHRVAPSSHLSPPPPGIHSASAGGELGVAAPLRPELAGPHQVAHTSLRTMVGSLPYRPTPESIASGFDVGVVFATVLIGLLGVCSRVYLSIRTRQNLIRTGYSRRLSKP